VAADVIYLHCPTIFTKSISNITANYFQDPGTGPAPACNGLNVTIDGQEAIRIWCVQNGLMKFELSTPEAKTYTLVATSNTDPVFGGDGTQESCTVRRSSFNVNITVPDIPILMIPLILAGGLLFIRRKKSV